MGLVGFQNLGEQDDPECSWAIPSSLTADQLKQSLDLVKKYEFSPPVFDDGQEAGDLIKRKSSGTAARKKAVFDDDDDGIDDDDEELMFPAGGPTAMKKSDALDALKKRRLRRRDSIEDGEDGGPSDEVLKARAEARRLKELEKNRKIKSNLYVQESDEEFDEERDRAFFEQEEKIRERSKITIMKELLGVGTEKSGLAKKNKKRESSAISAGSDDNGDDDILITSSRKRHSSMFSDESDGEPAGTSERSASITKDDVLADSNDEAMDTPMSSPHGRPSQPKKRKITNNDLPTSRRRSKDVAMELDDDDEDAIPISRPARQRVRAGFIVDSSDEE